MPSTTRPETKWSTKSTSIRLWIVQGLLATLFLFAGVMKLAMPVDQLAAQSHLPGAFMQFIGLCETLGALALLLPGLLRIRTSLTPLAAGGLMIIMIGASAIGASSRQLGPVLMPLLIALLSGYVAYGRWQRAPHRESPRYENRQPAR
jgi:hypothetical protein